MKRSFCLGPFAAALSLSAASLVSPSAFADDPLTDPEKSASDYQTPAPVVVAGDETAGEFDDSTVDEPYYVTTPYVEQPVAQTAALAPAPCNCMTSCQCAAETKKKKEELAAAMKSAYKGVFYANNFAYLNSPLYDGPFFPGDPFKGLLDGRLDLGGEVRSRYHHENNHRGLGLTGNDDQFWLTRLRAVCKPSG